MREVLLGAVVSPHDYLRVLVGVALVWILTVQRWCPRRRTSFGTRVKLERQSGDLADTLSDRQGNTFDRCFIQGARNAGPLGSSDGRLHESSGALVRIRTMLLVPSKAFRDVSWIDSSSVASFFGARAARRSQPAVSTCVVQRTLLAFPAYTSLRFSRNPHGPYCKKLCLFC